MFYVSRLKWVNILPEIHTLLQSRREEISADMPRDRPWAPNPQMFKPLSNLSTPLERTRTRGDLMSVRLESILMKLLLGTCWIALEPCGSRSYFLALLSDFSCCLNLDLVFEFESLSRPKVLLCSYISVISELVLSGSFSWARILLCFYSSWTREFTVAYVCSLANQWNKLNFHWTVKGA